MTQWELAVVLYYEWVARFENDVRLDGCLAHKSEYTRTFWMSRAAQYMSKE